jgi:uncharacterized membrane protein YjfL (UPF0719 family)
MSDFSNVPPPPAFIQTPPNSGLAIASLVTGILSWVLIPIIGAIIAVITGHMAKRQIRESNGQLSGDGMATAGLILGYVNLLLVACPCCVIVILALLGPAIGNVFSNIILEI